MNIFLRTVAPGLVALSMGLASSVAISSTQAESTAVSTSQQPTAATLVAANSDFATPPALFHRRSSNGATASSLDYNFDALSDAVNSEIRHDLADRLRSEFKASP